ncbi:MAG: flavodoxin family protein [Planctomycetota bacterium]|nr:flavodoxin family protein [Planctomycetota bacterium]
MRLLCVNGSPRQGGNSEALLREAMKGAQAEGARTVSVTLNSVQIRPCQGCEECKVAGTCRQKDGMRSLYSKIDRANGIILAAPVYMTHLSAQTKLFIDRLYSYITSDFKSRLAAGKRVVLITTQGEENAKTYAGAMRTLSTVFGWLGFKVTGKLVATALGPRGDAQKRKALLKRAFDLGRRLARPAAKGPAK